MLQVYQVSHGETFAKRYISGKTSQAVGEFRTCEISMREPVSALGFIL